MTRRPAACVDLDGVLVGYDGWNGDGHVGALIDGAARALQDLDDAGYRIVVFTARSPPYSSIIDRLRENRVAHLVDEITNTKPKDAVIFFDDRGWRVESDTPGALLAAVRSWLDLHLVVRT